jgi:DNA repair ATPase RecN
MKPKAQENLNRRQIDSQYLREENSLRRSIERLTHGQDKKIENLTAQLEAITCELEATKKELARAVSGYKRRKADLAVAREEIEHLNSSLRFYKETMRGLANLVKQTEYSHQKLSLIVRFSMSPDRYLEWREFVEDTYPQFRNRPE